jgi:hypothetical protein
MRFLVAGVGERLLAELHVAREVTIATAYALPDDATLAALQSAPKVTLIFSEEFGINDPDRLESLARTATVVGIRTDHPHGKLHAKVVLCVRGDGSRWALVGSANLTHGGLFVNQEACIELDSRNPADAPEIGAIAMWLTKLSASAKQPDWAAARLIWKAEGEKRLSRTATPRAQSGSSVGYWALKTTSGGETDHWPQFQAEQVVAIGWEGVAVWPPHVTDSVLANEVRTAYPNYSVVAAQQSARKLRRFFSMAVGDLVLILRGYAGNQSKPVHIYGVARIEGPAFDDPTSAWWRFKFPAVVQSLGIELPRDVVAAALGRESLLEAIHQIDEAGFDRVRLALRQAEGVALQV